jgi:hypothetical protein
VNIIKSFEKNRNKIKQKVTFVISLAFVLAISFNNTDNNIFRKSFLLRILWVKYWTTFDILYADNPLIFWALHNSIFSEHVKKNGECCDAQEKTKRNVLKNCLLAIILNTIYAISDA